MENKNFRNVWMVWLIIISIFATIANVHTSVSISANFISLNDYSRGNPFVNLVRQARPWGSPASPWDGTGTYDAATGWPNSDFGVVFVTSNIDMGGAYQLYAKGNADISVDFEPQTYITDKTYDPTTNILSAIINIPESTTQIMIGFRNTTGPGLQDIILLQPGYDLTSKSNITNLMLAHISRFSLLRFMDWTNTNGNPEVNWSDTTPVDWPQYTSPKNTPWQTIPFIVNQVNTTIDIWINIPFGASDDYILNVARIMLSDLKPSNNIYVEYSNELWNFGFSQSHDNIAAANDSVVNHGDPYHLNYDSVSDVYTWGFRRTAYQIKHISDLFKTVFGNDNVGSWKRVRPILAGQAANSYIIDVGLEYLNNVFGPPANFLHGIAIAPYFDLGEYQTWSNLTVDQVLDALNSSVDQFLPEQGWSETAQIGVHGVKAAWYNLAVYGYEGGPDTAAGCGECSLDAKIDATRDPRMADVCIRFLNGWYEYGFQQLNWYAAGAGEITKYGSWSLLEDLRQETIIDTTHMFNASSPVAQLPRPSPKLKAVDQIRQSSISMTFGIPIPSSNVNATNFAGHKVPYPDPDLRNLGVNSTFFYPLQVLQSPIQIKLTVYVAGNPGILEAGINNGQFVQVQTPQTASTTTFAPAPVIQLNINQPVVPSSVTLRLQNIVNGYSISSFDVVLS